MEETEIKVERHVLVPEHIKLSKEEAQEVLQTFNISFKQLPIILKSDKALKNLDVNHGDVIKIIRKSPVVGEAVFYRGVKNG